MIGKWKMTKSTLRISNTIVNYQTRDLQNIY